MITKYRNMVYVGRKDLKPDSMHRLHFLDIIHVDEVKTKFFGLGSSTIHTREMVCSNWGSLWKWSDTDEYVCADTLNIKLHDEANILRRKELKNKEKNV